MGVKTDPSNGAESYLKGLNLPELVQDVSAFLGVNGFVNILQYRVHLGHCFLERLRIQVVLG